MSQAVLEDRQLSTTQTSSLTKEQEEHVYSFLAAILSALAKVNQGGFPYTASYLHSLYKRPVYGLDTFAAIQPEKKLLIYSPQQIYDIILKRTIDEADSHYLQERVREAFDAMSFVLMHEVGHLVLQHSYIRRCRIIPELDDPNLKYSPDVMTKFNILVMAEEYLANSFAHIVCGLRPNALEKIGAAPAFYDPDKYNFSDYSLEGLYKHLLEEHEDKVEEAKQIAKIFNQLASQAQQPGDNHGNGGSGEEDKEDDTQQPEENQQKGSQKSGSKKEQSGSEPAPVSQLKDENGNPIDGLYAVTLQDDKGNKTTVVVDMRRDQSTKVQEKEAHAKAVEVAESVQKDIEQQVRTGKHPGDNPLGAMREIMSLYKPKTRLLTVLKDYARRASHRFGYDSTTFAVPDRRYLVQHKTHVPGTVSKDMKVVFAIDTSGSMGDDDLSFCWSELVGALKRNHIRTMVKVIACDTESTESPWIQKHKLLGNLEYLSKLTVGGGGTEFTSMAEIINNTEHDLAIIASDFYVSPEPLLTLDKDKTVMIATSDYDRNTVSKLKEAGFPVLIAEDHK